MKVTVYLRGKQVAIHRNVVRYRCTRSSFGTELILTVKRFGSNKTKEITYQGQVDFKDE